MDKLLAQIILAARNEDAEGWMNTLVVVLLAVFWAIGGILKARAKKTGAADEDEGDEEKPLKPIAHRAEIKPVYKTRGAEVKHPQQPPRRQIGAETLAAKIEPKVAEREAETTVAKTEEKAAIEQILSADEPGELKKAILHYEILGKPMSLRKPEDGRRM
ncbi:MAG: hypothetical protein MUO27_03375 [Sedimentisphaerales bacterium]|nr:hypothetical protein [Sedimentisphaerales bacterium]